MIWDNRCTMHRATWMDPGQKRDMRRVTAQDYASTVEQAAGLVAPPTSPPAISDPAAEGAATAGPTPATDPPSIPPPPPPFPPRSP